MGTLQDLGLVTAYGYAKAGGYSGSEEDFESYLANLPEYADDAADSATAAANSATAAADSVTAASSVYNDTVDVYNNTVSEAAQAVEAENRSEQFATNSATYMAGAAGHAADAAASALAASSSESITSDKAAEATRQATTATTQARMAQQFAIGAEETETRCEAIADNAADSALLSQSWAIGGTGIRENEDTNNSEYWCHQAESIVGLNEFVGATEITDGVRGLVPAPHRGEQASILMGDARWHKVAYTFVGTIEEWYADPYLDLYSVVIITEGTDKGTYRYDGHDLVPLPNLTKETMIAPMEDGETSSNSYSVGNLLVRDHKLWEAMAPIGAGDTFIEFSNIMLVNDLSSYIPKTVNDLQDVVIFPQSLGEGQPLVYDTTSQKWISRSSLSVLDNAIIEGPNHSVDSQGENGSVHVEGLSNTVSGRCPGGHIEGQQNTISETVAHAEGQQNTASGVAAHVEGQQNTASGDYSHAECSGTTASGDNSHAEGSGTTASGDNSHAEGSLSVAQGTCAHAEGASTSAVGNYAHSEGNTSSATGDYSHAEGASSTANGVYSHAEGYKTYTSANASYAHAEGGATSAVGNYTHSEGYQTCAAGTYTHVEGRGTYASGSGSHAEGSGTAERNITATGIGSHAEGYATNSGSIIARGNGSHTEGYANEGMLSAEGTASHAEGFNTQAYGSYSHSEGARTIAQGDYSHAEGGGTIANAEYSHAEGLASNAYALYSHAEGAGGVTGTMYKDGATTANSAVFAHGSTDKTSYNCITDTTEHNIFSFDSKGNFFANGAQTLCRGVIEGVLVAKGEIIQLEDGADYILYANTRYMGPASCVGKFRGVQAYIIGSTWNPAGKGTSTTANAVPQIASLGAVGTVGVNLSAKTVAYTNEEGATRYHSAIGIGTCTTTLKARWNLIKVLGSEDDFG